MPKPLKEAEQTNFIARIYGTEYSLIRLRRAIKAGTMRFDFFSVHDINEVKLVVTPHLEEGRVYPYGQDGSALGVWVLPEEEVGS